MQTVLIKILFWQSSKSASRPRADLLQAAVLTSLLILLLRPTGPMRTPMFLLMKVLYSQSSESASEKERDKERPMSNGHLQNPKPLRDRTSEAHALPLAVWKDSLRRETTSASQQNCLQRAYVTRQISTTVIWRNLAPQAQAVLQRVSTNSNREALRPVRL